MGRKKTPLNDLFTVVERDGMKSLRAVCKYCLNEISNNGSRKMEHRCHSVSNLKKRKINEDESEFESSDSEESIMIHYDNSSNQSLDTILGNSGENVN